MKYFFVFLFVLFVNDIKIYLLDRLRIISKKDICS